MTNTMYTSQFIMNFKLLSKKARKYAESKAMSPSILEFLNEQADGKLNILSPGDQIAKIVLGECRISSVEEVIRPDSGMIFYRGEDGMFYSFEDGTRKPYEAVAQASEEREKHLTIKIPDCFESKREFKGNDGSWAVVGITNGRLYLKYFDSYQFMLECSDSNALRKQYEYLAEMIEKQGAPLDCHGYSFPHSKYLYLTPYGFYADAEVADYMYVTDDKSWL